MTQLVKNTALGEFLPLTNGTEGQVMAITSAIPAWTSATTAGASSTLPTIDAGAGAIGVGTTYARADHQHPFLAARIASDVAITSNATLANITGLSVAVAAGATYSFEVYLYTTSNASGGVLVAVGGTATATAITYDTMITNGGTTTQSTRQAALGGSGVGVTSVTAANVSITGTITVNAAGTLTIMGAQNSSNAAATTFLRGSTITVIQY
jgi:hypothetical protein